MACKVDRQALRERALRSLDAVAGAVCKQGDGFTILSCCEGSLKRFVFHVTNLSDVVDRIDEHVVLININVVTTISRAVINLDEVV